jgi:hypothetical protein
MAKPKNPTPPSGRKLGKRVIVEFGLGQIKVKGNTTTVKGFSRMTERAAEILGAQAASSDKLKTEKGRILRGSKGAKNILCVHPTEKGKNGGDKFVSVPVPSWSTVAQIQKFLAPLKTEWFRIDGQQYPATDQ